MTRGKFQLVLAIAVAALVTSVSPIREIAAWQQPQMDETSWKRGYHGFGMICRSLELEPQTDLSEWRRTPPDESMLILLGSVDRTQIDLARYLNAGGVVLLASDGNNRINVGGRSITFDSIDSGAVNQSDSFRGYRDCPIVTDIDHLHPAVQGISSIVTNRPGRLYSRSPFERSFRSGRVLASLPVLRPNVRGRTLIAAIENGARWRALCVADQSVFSNQMLFYHQNALFALKALDWLRDGKPKKVLLVVDGNIADPFDPSSVDVEIPPPTRDEVMRALRQMPPDVLIDFGNAVATVIEDEGMVNEFVTTAMRSISVRQFNRVLIFLGTLTLCMIAGLTWIARGATLGPPSGLEKFGTKKASFQAASERKLAAETAIDGFCTRVAGRTISDWKDFPAGVSITGADFSAKQLERSMNRVNRKLRSQLPWYWSRNRLEELEQEIRKWEQLYLAGSLTYDSERGRVAEEQL